MDHGVHTIDSAEFTVSALCPLDGTVALAMLLYILLDVPYYIWLSLAV